VNRDFHCLSFIIDVRQWTEGSLIFYMEKTLAYPNRTTQQEYKSKAERIRHFKIKLKFKLS
jgi:hypothetical protein